MAESENCGSSWPQASCAGCPIPSSSAPEVAALLFNVSDIAVTLTNLERLLGEEENGEEEADEG